jgi:myosin heavy subunit
MKTLDKMMKIPEKPPSKPTDSNNLLTPSDYFKQRLEQTEYIEIFTEKFTEISKKLEEIHKTKTKDFTKRLEILINFINEKVKHPEPRIEELKKNVENIQNFTSLDELTQSLIKLSELQKELEILQRKYDFKNYLLMQEAKNKEKEAMKARIEEVKAHIEKLNSNWADMKDEQRKKAEEMQNLQDSIVKNKTKILELTEKKEDLQENLKKFGKNMQSYEETLQILNEKTSDLEKLQKELEEINEKVTSHSHNHLEMETLKKRKSCLAGEVGDLSGQINYLLDLQKRANEESAKKDEEEMKLRLAMIKELQEEIQFKSQQMEKISEMYVNDLRSQVAQNLIQRFKEIPKAFLMKWKIFAISKGEKVESNENRNIITQVMTKVKTENSWEKQRFLTFFIKFLSEKYKKDEQALKESKLPMPINEFLEIYMKTLYDEDWEVQCKMMLNLITSDITDDLFNIMKSLTGLSKDHISYTFSLFLPEALHYFETNKTFGSETVSFESIFTLVESFTENKREVMVPLLYKMKSEGITDENYVLHMLKIKLNKLGMQFTDYCDSAESFMDVALNDFELLVDEQVLLDFKEKCEREFDMNFDMKIDVSVNTLVSSKFQVNRATFLTAFVEVYKEFLAKEVLVLEKIVARAENINEELFTKFLSQIAPELAGDTISGVFNEALADSSDSSSLKPQNFIQIILKYAIGGFGIGPFRTSKLQTISKNLLSTVLRSRKSEETKKVIKPKDLPIKIFLAKEDIPTSIATPNNRLLRAGTVGKKLGDIRKSASPSYKSEKNIRKELPLPLRPPSRNK